jgi:transglutaminase-like putative cysteine protease
MPTSSSSSKPVRLAIEHRTSFSYESPIAEAQTELRLRPLDGSGQHCTSFRLVTDPPGIRIRFYLDHLGNQIQHFDLLEPHDRLTVTALSEVHTSVAFVDESRIPSQLELYDYRAPTEYVALSAGVRDFAGAHAGAGSAAERATRLSDAIFAGFAYETGVTDVQTRADEVLALGRGVCQDFAHLLLAACRCEGIPARYVSGYLYDQTAAGDAAASHAWVDILDDVRGWVSLDPTHGREQTEAYVRVAVGRDYADVPPTRGVYKGPAHETLAVRVALTAL